MNRIAPSVLAATIATVSLTTGAAAHPGHGLDTGGLGLLHFLLQPSHAGVGVLVAVALCAAVTVRKLRRRHG